VINRANIPVIPQNFGQVGSKQKTLKIRHPQVKSRIYEQPPYRHDFINFKMMSGNEILLNLENSEFLRNSELVNALIELSKRKDQRKHDWEIHPYTKLAFDEVKKRSGQFEPKHVSQLCHAMKRLNYNNNDFWDKMVVQVSKVIHKFSGNELADFMDLYSPDVEDDLDDDSIYLDKEIMKKQMRERADGEFLQRIVTIFPQYVKNLDLNRLIKVCEVCVKQNLGDDRLYSNFLFFYIEKKIASVKIPQYLKILKVLGDKRYTEDIIFWNNFIFPWIYTKPRNQSEAQHLWEALIALKVKCPELSCEIPINYIESLLKKFELIDGFVNLNQEAKDTIVEIGDLPEGVRTTIQKHTTLASKSLQTLLTFH
jgi:hypothetical protein